jgi:subfamily B ATP-binding cassette protein MsbA
MVSQETTLFDDTIKNNIKYGRENATDEEVLKQPNYLTVMNL